MELSDLVGAANSRLASASKLAGAGLLLYGAATTKPGYIVAGSTVLYVTSLSERCAQVARAEQSRELMVD